jgi:hypothetical protein
MVSKCGLINKESLKDQLALFIVGFVHCKISGITLMTDGAPQPQLLDQLRNRIRLKGHSIRTENVYVDWIKWFAWFQDERHPPHVLRHHFLNPPAADRL